VPRSTAASFQSLRPTAPFTRDLRLRDPQLTERLTAIVDEPRGPDLMPSGVADFEMLAEGGGEAPEVVDWRFCS
jgi:hypothetical protein